MPDGELAVRPAGDTARSEERALSFSESFGRKVLC